VSVALSAGLETLYIQLVCLLAIYIYTKWTIKKGLVHDVTKPHRTSIS